MDDVVAAGEATACAEGDFTVKVDVGGLGPATTYHYRFDVGGESSPVGRTRTAPAGMAAGLRLGVVACASYSAGYFNAYANLARREVDLVVHVGDYIYENSGVMLTRRVRRYPPRAATTLAQYRARHALHKADPDLQALHLRHPMVAAWDDHEVAGGSWAGGAIGHRAGHGDWGRRQAAAVQAYAEWMPVRLPDPSDPSRIHRTVHLGGLADLVMIDTRLAGRDKPAGGGSRPVLAVLNRRRSLLGAEQREWLHGELRAGARWKLIGNQVVMAPLPALHAGPVALGVNAGQWDGYPGERDDLFRFLAAEGLQVVVLSGDLHSSWAMELPAGVEFVTPGVSSPSFAQTILPDLPGATRLASRVFRWQNRHVRMVDLERHGYVVLDVTPERVQDDWWHVETVAERSDREHYAGGWVVRHGETTLEPASGPASGPIGD